MGAPYLGNRRGFNGFFLGVQGFLALKNLQILEMPGRIVSPTTTRPHGAVHRWWTGEGTNNRSFLLLRDSGWVGHGVALAIWAIKIAPTARLWIWDFLFQGLIFPK